MDRDEALELLRGGPVGIQEWNTRRRSDGVIPDLSRVDLAGADLRRVDLHDANLTGANLSEANLHKGMVYGSKLINATLRKAHLRKSHIDFTDFSGANLDGAIMNKAECMRANFSGAKLTGASLVKLKSSQSDFSDADLEGADLTKADLSITKFVGANLKRAILRDVNLIGADSSRADLSGVDLFRLDLLGIRFRDAILVGANLCSVNLRNAKMDGADLSSALLQEADLTGTRLTGTNFSKAECRYTLFITTDLSVAQGLASVRHVGPSLIGTDTLFLSKGKIPEAFLRGCGLTPWEVLAANLYRPELSPPGLAKLQKQVFDAWTKGRNMINGCFISYSWKDSKFVDKLCNRLVSEGVNVWLDKRDMVAGAIQHQVWQEIQNHHVFLLVLSEDSVKSDWVENELDMARSKEREEDRAVLCPIALDDAWKAKVEAKNSPGDPSRQLWRTLQQKLVIDCSRWKTKAFEESFKKLLRGLKTNYGP